MLMGAAESPTTGEHAVRFGFGAGVDWALHDPFEVRFGFPLVEAWAMTETGAGAVVGRLKRPRQPARTASAVRVTSWRCRIVGDDGAEAGRRARRIAGSSRRPRPALGFFREYLKDAEATAEAWDGGWFHTGDVVRRGADRSLHFVDRKKNVIRRSGENISAVEVESVLMQHLRPASRGCACARPGARRRGVRLRSQRRPTAGRRLARADRGRHRCRSLSRLAYYKAPGYVAFVSAVPLTSTQKIQRGALKDLVAATIHSDMCVDTRPLKKRPVQKAG